MVGSLVLRAPPVGPLILRVPLVLAPALGNARVVMEDTGIRGLRSLLEVARCGGSGEGFDGVVASRQRRNLEAFPDSEERERRIWI